MVVYVPQFLHHHTINVNVHLPSLVQHVKLILVRIIFHETSGNGSFNHASKYSIVFQIDWLGVR